MAIANTLAYLSESIDPISIFIGLTRRDLMDQAIRYLLFGEGETGLMLYTILLRYWQWTPEDDVRPLIFLMSHQFTGSRSRTRAPSTSVSPGWRITRVPSASPEVTSAD